MVSIGHVPHLVAVPALGSAPLKIGLFAVWLLKLELWFAAALFNIVEQFEVLGDGFNRLVNKSSSQRNKLVAF
jgi:hypothetical protein